MADSSQQSQSMCAADDALSGLNITMGTLESDPDSGTHRARSSSCSATPLEEGRHGSSL